MDIDEPILGDDIGNPRVEQLLGASADRAGRRDGRSAVRSRGSDRPTLGRGTSAWWSRCRDARAASPPRCDHSDDHTAAPAQLQLAEPATSRVNRARRLTQSKGRLSGYAPGLLSARSSSARRSASATPVRARSARTICASTLTSATAVSTTHRVTSDNRVGPVGAHHEASGF